MKKEFNILIVDDIEENRKLLAKILKENKNYNISLAKDGISVLKYIKDFLPDLILLDIMMPGMDGFTVAKELKKNINTKDIPIIFITALSSIEDKSKAFEAGGIDFLTKPFNPLEVKMRIKNHLE